MRSRSRLGLIPALDTSRVYCLPMIKKPIATVLLMLVCSACFAQEHVPRSPGQCLPEPVARPAVEPSAAFWRAHPQAGITIALLFRVAPDGSVSDARALPGEYDSAYANEAMRAVRRWSFKPFTCAPDGVWLQTRLRFEGPDGSI